MSFLLSLITGLFKGWLGIKAQTAENLGKAEQEATDLQASLDTANAEAKAAANAPKGDALIEALKDGKVSIILLALLILSSCAIPVSSNVCPTKTPFTAAEEDEMAANLSVLPLGSPLRLMSDDWSSLRFQADCCRHPENKVCQAGG